MIVFDAHFHIIDYRYKLLPNNGYTPPEFTVDQYRSSTEELDIRGGTIVSGSFQAFDQQYLLDALDTLGSSYYGVANIPHTISDQKIAALYESNIVAVRFNLKRGGSETLEHLDYLSNKLYEEFGWHTELYVDSSNLPDLRKALSKLKDFSIDHLGLSKAGQKELLHWVDKGARVKATGFGRLDFDPISFMQDIMTINPEALMFGTDLPSTRSKTPFSIVDIHQIQEHFDEDDQLKICYQNAFNWYSRKRN